MLGHARDQTADVFLLFFIGDVGINAAFLRPGGKILPGKLPVQELLNGQVRKAQLIRQMHGNLSCSIANLEAGHALQGGEHATLDLLGHLGHGAAVPQQDEQVHHDALAVHLHPDALGGHLLAGDIVGDVGVHQTAHALHLQAGGGGDGGHHVLRDLDGAHALLMGHVFFIISHSMQNSSFVFSIESQYKSSIPFLPGNYNC